ncbi:MAG: GldM family protein [Bacteroidales bacterium]
MAGFKETPRQKMIAMMYLVLTALLALNVSVEILNAFVTVNEGMQTTNSSLTEKVNSEYSKFKVQNDLQPAKVGTFYNQALDIKKQADELVVYIDRLKLKLIAAEEQKSEKEALKEYFTKERVPDPTSAKLYREVNVVDLGKVGAKDKYDQATRILVKRKEGYKLADKMTDFRNKVLQIKGIEDPQSGAIGLNTSKTYIDNDGLKQDWVTHTFYHIILAADITILNKIINEVRTAEFDAVNSLYAQINEEDFKFDNVAAKVIPTSTYVLENSKYEAEVLVAAYDSKNNSQARVRQGISKYDAKNSSGYKVVQGEDGVVKLSFAASSPGIKKYAGAIDVKGPDGNTKSYPFSGEYVVAPPSLTVAATKMNVFYIGVQNPVSISVPGVPSSNIHPAINAGGKLTSDGKGGYFVEVTKAMKKAVVSATASIDGKEVPMGESTFRVKRIPSPQAEVANQLEGKLPKNQLIAAGAVIPKMKDFDFDLNFVITKFNMSTVINGDNVTKRTNGNRFTPEMVSLIKNARPGQKFYFENIEAVGPDKVKRSLNPVSLEIK